MKEIEVLRKKLEDKLVENPEGVSMEKFADFVTTLGDIEFYLETGVAIPVISEEV